MKDNKKEKVTKNEIEPASLEVTENIIYQMKKCVCKIYINGITGTGFFAKIPYNNELLNVLITNNHILGENEIANDQKITFSLNNDENDKKDIEMYNERKRYTNVILDVTIIEIDENKDDIHDFIELDNEIINSMKLNKDKIIKKFKDIYNNKSIYILNYLKGENIMVSYGLISDINENNGINHKCHTDKGSFGAPILSLKNNKLIGIVSGGSEKKDINKGTLIIYPLIEFQNISNDVLVIKKEGTNTLNEITLKYNIKDKKRIKLFGNKFINNNKRKCKIIIENKEQDIVEFLDINKIKKDEKEEKEEKKTIEIKLKIIKTLTNMSHMFGDKMYDGCYDLLSITDIGKVDTRNVTNMSCMFSGCSSLSSLAEISEWDTISVTNMSYMFSGCSSLSSLPDISKWDTSNVTNMSYMFDNCKSLASLPDISKWDISNVTNISYLFNNCSVLNKLPEISQWDISNVTNMSYMFNCCKSLSSLPSEISKWNTAKVTNMSFMFNGCRALSSLPDISKWDINNVTNMSFMFEDCRSLSSFKIPPKFK